MPKYPTVEMLSGATFTLPQKLTIVGVYGTADGAIGDVAVRVTSSQGQVVARIIAPSTGSVFGYVPCAIDLDAGQVLISSGGANSYVVFG